MLYGVKKIRDCEGEIYLEQEVGKSIFNFSSLAKFFMQKYRNVTTKQINLLCLDDDLKVIDHILIAESDYDIDEIDSQDLLKKALKTNCKYHIISHNNLEKRSRPTKSDIIFTRGIFEIFLDKKINLLDHVIYGVDGITSMCYDGYFNPFEM